METLVLKCKEIVDNPNLRSFGEFRIGLASRGDGTGASTWQLSSVSTPTIPVKWKVVSGDAYFKLSGSSETYTEIETQSNISIYCTSGKAVIAVKNFDSVATQIILSYVTSDDSPSGILYTDELLGKDFIRYVKGPYSSTTITQIEGSLSNIGVFSDMEIFKVGRDSIDSNCVYSIEDLVAFPNAEISIIRGINTGGDVYRLLMGINVCNITANRSNYNTIEHEQKQLTCSYTSGQDLPTLTFTRFDMFENNTKDTFALNDLKAFLQLLKDGIDGETITVASGATVVVNQQNTSIWNNEDVVALRTYLEGKGITFTKY